MLNNTMERLIHGDTGVVNDYQTALNLWAEIFENPKSSTVDGLAEMLGSNQLTFEHQCGGRWVGQEIMVASGIYQFYSTAIGFEGNLGRAQLVANAFARSMCSSEVKHHAREIATALFIFE